MVPPQPGALDLEVCCTLGMLTPGQAVRLKQAGLTAYNHNLDTSSEFYGQIISTRSYEERLATIARVRGGGHHRLLREGFWEWAESASRTASVLLCGLATLDPHPESVPINLLVRRPKGRRSFMPSRSIL